MPGFVIDKAVFDDLKESVGVDFIAELVSAFLEEAPTYIAQLRPALVAGNIETFRRATHSVKSNAATFGVTRLFELARELEFMARENRLGEIGTKLEELEEVFRCASGALEELCL